MVVRAAILGVAVIGVSLSACGSDGDTSSSTTVEDINARALAAVIRYGPADATDEERAAQVEPIVSVCELADESLGGRIAMAEAVADSAVLGDVYGDVCPDALAAALAVDD